MRYSPVNMRFSIYRDLSSIQFVRCFALLPNQDFGVGGAGFTLKTAVAKCKSEYVERLFQIEGLSKARMPLLGIAAHPVSEQLADESALFEAAESLMLKRIKKEMKFLGVRIFSIGKFSLYLTRVDGFGYFGLLRGAYLGKPLLAYSSRKSILQTLLKLWEEFRNPFFHKMSLDYFRSFSKSTILFSDEEALDLRFRHSIKKYKLPALDEVQVQRQKYLDHYISYIQDFNEGEKHEIA